MAHLIKLTSIKYPRIQQNKNTTIFPSICMVTVSHDDRGKDSATNNTDPSIIKCYRISIFYSITRVLKKLNLKREVGIDIKVRKQVASNIVITYHPCSIAGILHVVLF